MRTPSLIITACASLLLAAGCASTPPPNADMAVTIAAVAHAAAAGAPELAPLEMRMAREKLERAQVAMGNRDYDAARMLASESQADAQLAESKADSVKARKAADETQEAGRALREEMSRKAP
jgi:hypothetical protein